MPEVPLDSPRMWADIPDPKTKPGKAPERVFHVDLTWLTSNWACIFGRGCQGIYADRPNDGCCTLGAHFSEAADERRVARFVRKLDDETWQRRGEGRRNGWVEEEENGGDEPARKTRVVDGACIFLNDPDFPGGAGCALHHLSARTGDPITKTKPEVCWQLPIRRTYRTVERNDGSSYLEVSIAEYDRRGWGEGGHELSWYCTGNTEAHIGAEPVYRSLETELRELLGNRGYEAVAAVCDDAMPTRRLLPILRHPAGEAAKRKGRR